MGTNFPIFSFQLKRAKAIVGAALVDHHRKVAIDALQRITIRTPVDTGFARGNWQVTIGASNDSVLEQQRGLDDVIAAARAQLAALPPYATIFIFNNADYIRFLEQGSSAQAPQGMVAVTLAEVDTLGV